MGIADEVQKMISVKIKPRQDCYFDQFSRIFLMKLMFVGAFFTGMTWYNDKTACIAPNGPGKGFINSACWVNGFYIYEDIRYNNDGVGYYGIPKSVDLDGIRPDGKLCSSKSALLNPRGHKDPFCEPMKKTYFLQYQYMTFFLVLVGSLYYLPYGFFKLINSDRKSLKDAIKNGNDADTIVESFFKRSMNRNLYPTYRVLGSILVRLLYVLINVVTFVLTDSVLNGGFTNYGQQWVAWSKLNNSMAYDYMGLRDTPKPGDAMLPPFAFCELFEAAKDIKHTIHNKHRLLCELSQHIVYQYIFIIIWFAMIIGMVISAIGLLKIFIDYGSKSSRSDVKYRLNLRECEYLEYIQKKDAALYQDIVRKLKFKGDVGSEP